MILEMVYQMVIKEFRAIVAITAFEVERQVGFDVLDLPQYAVGAFIPGGPALGPAAAIVGNCKAPDEVTGKAVTTVSNRIGLNKPGFSNISGMCSDGNLIAQQGAGLGAAGPLPDNLARMGAWRSDWPYYGSDSSVTCNMSQQSSTVHIWVTLSMSQIAD